MKFTHIIAAFISIFLLNSCFEIVEDVTFHKDGKGHLKIILNGSQSRSDINAILILKEVNGYPVPSITQMRTKIESFTDSVSKMPGFSNVQSTFDDINYILVFEADFDKVERLNTGIYALWNKFDPLGAKRETYFKFRDDQFSRQPGQLFNLLYQKMKTADRKVLTGATYTSLYRFNQTILSQQNTTAKTSKNQNVSLLKLPLQLLIEKPSYWYNVITLKH